MPWEDILAESQALGSAGESSCVGLSVQLSDALRGRRSSARASVTSSLMFGGSSTPLDTETLAELPEAPPTPAWRREILRTCAFLRVAGTGASSTVLQLIHVPSLTLLAGKIVSARHLAGVGGAQSLAKEIDALMLNAVPLDARVLGAPDSLESSGSHASALVSSSSHRSLRQSSSSSDAPLAAFAFAGGGVVGGALQTVASSPELVVQLAAAPAIGTLVKDLVAVGALGSTRVLPVARCPFLLTFYDACVLAEGEGVLLLSEFCDGDSLAALLQSPLAAHLSEGVVSNIVWRIASGLAHLHSLLIAHRDVKPANVLMFHTGVVKLGDFGTVFQLAAPDGTTTEQAGSPLYQSPAVPVARAPVGRALRPQRRRVGAGRHHARDE